MRERTGIPCTGSSREKNVGIFAIRALFRAVDNLHTEDWKSHSAQDDNSEDFCILT